MKLAGQYALVTGGGRGIGKGCALELAREGANIILNDRPGGLDGEQAAEEIRSLGRECYVVEADVFARSGCEELVETTLNKVPQIDILISNPAFGRRGGFLDYSPELYERTINGTLSSGFHMSQLVARHMVERGGQGKIVFISSVHAEMPIANSFAYGTAKAGLNHLMRSIAVELVQHHINVNAIEPGWIDTPGEHATFSEDTIQAEGEKLPLSRLGQPSDIGKAATFLSSSDANYITGTVLTVDGLFRYKDCMAENNPKVKEAN